MLSERAIPMQGIHTNNFTESYHRVLKYNFLSRHTLRRPDDTIQVLVDTAEADFRQSCITTSLGFRPQRSTKYQNIAKGLADSYSDADLIDLGVSIVKLSVNKWSASSFTRPLATTYHISTTPPIDGRVGYINNCTCAHYIKNKSACKHMYVLARQTGFKILETNPEMDDGISPFVPRGITQPFNLVVQAVTSVHLDSPVSSPPLAPYRSSSGMAQTPSTTGLTSGTFQYAPMVPAPIPYERPTHQDVTPALHRSPSASAGTPSINPSTTQAYSDTSSRWLPVSTHLTTGCTDQASDSYISRLMADPHHLQSTPPRIGTGCPPGTSHRAGVAPYPPSPFASAPVFRRRSPRPPEPITYNFSPTTSRTSHAPFAPSTSSRSPRRHHPYRYTEQSAAGSTLVLPTGPPPTQVNYELDPFSLMRRLEPHAAYPIPSAPPYHHPVRTPEVTPTPITTSQLDGLFHEMEAGHARAGLTHLPPPRYSNSNTRSPGASQSEHSSVTPGHTTPSYMASSSSQPMVSNNTNQSIDQGPSFLTESEVDAMNAVELQFYKKKDDLAELMKILHKINAEAPFNDEAGILNRASPSLIAAMRQRAADFLTTLRSFNSNNRTSKQRR
ncbi:hypothetical protein DFH28DRAFT_890570 [Melampsora americana]|nr:hypothetical protein DFH28DRAFT_890570 [Melampsora americana]